MTRLAERLGTKGRYRWPPTLAGRVLGGFACGGAVIAVEEGLPLRALALGVLLQN